MRLRLKLSSGSFSQMSENGLTSGRVDEVEQYYWPIDQLEKWLSLLFWVSAVLSVIVLYADQIPWSQVQEVPATLFAVVVLIHFAISQYVRFYLLPNAERKRRQQLLSNAFGVPITSEATNQYYNNELAPSVARLGANVLENAFFTKSVSRVMAARERIKLLIYGSVWLLALFWRSTDLDLVLLLTQIIFSGEVLVKWISLELLRERTGRVYDELYKDFLHSVDVDSPAGIASLLDSFASYEAAKASGAINLSSPIFSRLNPELSTEWNKIRQRLGLRQD